MPGYPAGQLDIKLVFVIIFGRDKPGHDEWRGYHPPRHSRLTRGAWSSGTVSDAS
jgi:hypothetical protein